MKTILILVAAMLLMPTAAADRTVEIANGAVSLEERTSHVGDPSDPRILTVTTSGPLPASVHHVNARDSGGAPLVVLNGTIDGTPYALMSGAICDRGMSDSEVECVIVPAVVILSDAVVLFACVVTDDGRPVGSAGDTCMAAAGKAGSLLIAFVVVDRARSDPGVCEGSDAQTWTCLRLTAEEDDSSVALCTGGQEGPWLSPVIRDDECTALGTWADAARDCVGVFTRTPDAREGILELVCTAG